MKRLLVGLLSVAIGQAHALSCVPSAPFAVVHTQVMGTKSVVWLNKVQSAPYAPVVLQTQGRKDVTMTQMVHSLPEWVALRPNQPYVVGQTYTVTSKLVPSEYAELVKLENSFLVGEIQALPQLSWRQKPVLKSVQITQSPWGQVGRVVLNLDVTALPENYLVMVKAAEKPNMQAAQTWLLQAASVDGQTQLVLHHGFCHKEHEAFWFQAGQTKWLTFDLIAHDGQITPWQGEPWRLDLDTQVEAATVN